MGREVTVIEMVERLVANAIGIHRTGLLDHMDKAGIRSLVNTKCTKIRQEDSPPANQDNIKKTRQKTQMRYNNT